MEFYVDKQQFQDEISALLGAIDAKSPIPILESILVTPQENSTIKMTATNMELSIISYKVVTDLKGTEALCIPSRKLFEIVKLMPDGMIKISGEANQWVRIDAKGSHYKIPGSNPNTFPEIKEPTDPESWLTVPAKTMKKILSGVEYASSKSNDNRYAIAGIKIEISNSQIMMAATDSHRIALSSGSYQNDDNLLLDNFDVLLPNNAVNELSKLLITTALNISLTLFENGIFFQVGSRLLYSRLLSGNFPVYEPLFRIVYPNFAVFRADELAQSVKRAMVVTSDSKFSAIVLHIKDGKIFFLASTAEEGECSEVLDTDYNGDEIRVACSGKFLVEYLETVGKDMVNFAIKDPDTPFLLQSKQDGVSFKYILIPMREK